MTRAAFAAMVRAGYQQRREAVTWLSRCWTEAFDLCDLIDHLIEVHRGDRDFTRFCDLPDEELIQLAFETTSQFEDDSDIGRHSHPLTHERDSR